MKRVMSLIAAFVLGLAGASTAGDLDVTGSVGIGTSTPTQKLHVIGNIRQEGTSDTAGGAGIFVGNGSALYGSIRNTTTGSNLALDVYSPTGWLNSMTIRRDNGSVGIGTTNPGSKLSVVGDISLTTELLWDTNGLVMRDTSWAGGPQIRNAQNFWIHIDSDADGTGVFGIRKGPDDGTAVDLLRVTNDGKVGIGTTTLGAKVDINAGTATGVRITTDNAAPWGLIINNATASETGLQMYQTNDGVSHIWADYNLGNGAHISMTPSGNVGIGIGNPQAKLHVSGTAGVDGVMFPDGTVQTTAASAEGWPAGSYCILKAGGSCPTGFTATSLGLFVGSHAHDMCAVGDRVAGDSACTQSGGMATFDLKACCK